MDVSVLINDMNFNYRCAAIIKNKDKILVSINDVKNFYTIPGGRANIGETSIEAVIREIKEETGFNTKYIKTLGVVENFYISRYNNKPTHEILIIHELEFVDKEAYELKEIKNLDELDNAKFIYKDINSLNKDNLRPSVLIDVLNSNNLIHIIAKQ